MKINLTKIGLTMLAIGIFLLAETHYANAISLFTIPAIAFIDLVGWSFHLTLTVLSVFLKLSGTLLNIAMFFTTNLDIFINDNGVVKIVWQIIRDLCSIVIIFVVLWAGIKMIIGQHPSGNLVKNVIIIGVLINFSFFFARVLIDASNIVSLQLYRAMAPTSAKLITSGDKQSFHDLLPKLMNSGGLSDVVMNQLRMPAFFTDNRAATAALASGQASSVQMGIDIIIKQSVSIIVVLLTSLQFAILALAAIWRIAILVFLLAFSPIWIAGIALPLLNDVGSKWWSTFKSQLLFLPAFLLFMYVALRIIQSLKLNEVVLSSNVSMENFASLFMAAAISIVMLTVPFIAALQFSGKSMAWTENLYKNTRGWMTGLIGRNTFGRSAASLNKTWGNTWAGNTATGRWARSITLGKVEGSKFGGTMTFADQKKEEKDIKKKGAIIERGQRFKAALKVNNIPEIAKQLEEMKTDEKLALGAKTLQNIEVMKRLEKDDFDAIKKSEDFSDEDKTAIKKARRDAFNKAVADDDVKVVKHMVNNMENKDLLHESVKDKLTNPKVIASLTAGKLKSLADDDMDEPTRKAIGKAIMDWKKNESTKDLTKGNHSAYGYIKKNWEQWLDEKPPEREG